VRVDGSAGADVGRVVHLDDHEYRVIAAALSKAEESKLAASMPGIGRDRLRYKIAKYRLKRGFWVPLTLGRQLGYFAH